MDVCIENVFPAVAMPFNPFQREPREDKRPEDKKRGDKSGGEKSHKAAASTSGASVDALRANSDALFASVRAETGEPELLDELIEYLSERVGNALRESGQRARTIGVQIRYMDQFSVRQTMRLTRPSNDEGDLLIEARELFASVFKRRVPIQMLGLSATNLAACSRSEELPDDAIVLAGAHHAAPLRVAARVGLR